MSSCVYARACSYVCVCVCVYVCVGVFVVVCACMCVYVFWLHSKKVLAQRIRYGNYTIWMTLQGTESSVMTFRSR